MSKKIVKDVKDIKDVKDNVKYDYDKIYFNVLFLNIKNKKNCFSVSQQKMSNNRN